MRYAFLDEEAKKEIRRSILKAIAIPGYIVSFASREMPVARGWGTGGLQVTLAIINESDTLKMLKPQQKQQKLQLFKLDIEFQRLNFKRVKL